VLSGGGWRINLRIKINNEDYPSLPFLGKSKQVFLTEVKTGLNGFSNYKEIPKTR
jgi:hypothetical protein